MFDQHPFHRENQRSVALQVSAKYLCIPTVRVREETWMRMCSRTHRAEVILKLVRTPSRGTEGGVEAGEVLAAAHLQEGRQVVRGEADEVQVARPATQRQVVQLQVHVADARLAIGRVGSQVAADALQVLHLLLLLLGCDVFRLKVHQLHQGSSDIHPEPGKSCTDETNSVGK